MRCSTVPPCLGVLRLVIALSALLVTRAPLWAQEENDLPWKDSFYPYLSSLSNDFPLLALRYEWRKPSDYFSRSPFAGRVAIDVAASTRGSRFAQVGFRAPDLWPKWRVVALGRAQRDARFGFFGLGNDTKFDESLNNKAQPFFYRAKRTRYTAQIEITRLLPHHFAVALAPWLERSRISALPGPSVFGQGNQVDDTDASARLTLLYDSRDNEYNTHQGLFVEASGTAGSGGDGYTRLTAIVRGYLQVREGTVLAARIAASGMGGDPPLNARFDLPTWENLLPVLGGAMSHRGLEYERLAGEHLLFTNAEVRHDLLNLGDYGAVTLIGFLDAGRVFEGEPFKLTTRGMKVGGGGAVGLRILRTTIVTFNFAGGPDGFQFSTGSGWAF